MAEDLFPRSTAPVTLREQIEAVEREIKMRRRVYPRWIAAGRMTEAKASFEIKAMEAVLVTLREIKT